jgi:hypothetical protein
VFSSVASSPEIRGNPGVLGQFKRDVLDDVREVSSFMQAFNESSGTPSRTTVFVDAGKHCEEAVYEAWNLSARYVRQLFKKEPRDEDGFIRVYIRACDGPDFVNPHDLIPLHDLFFAFYLSLTLFS